eukprot:g2224.t1
MVLLDSETALNPLTRWLLAFSYFGQIYAIATFLLHGVFIFNVYYGAPAGGIGVAGVIMGFYNALNGLPIARLADAGYLNEKFGGCFPLKKCGRRGPWVFLGVPQLALASLFLLMPVSSDPSVLIFWFIFVYLLVSNGFTAVFQSTLAILQETMYTDKMRARQTLMAVPFNLVAYTISGLILPAALFSVTPDVITNCCIQPLASCLKGSAQCACYTTNNESELVFLDNYAKKCVASTIDSVAYKAKCVDADVTVDGGSFLFWGIISFVLIMTSLVAMVPASKSIAANKNEPLYLIPSIKEAVKVRSFRWLAWFNFFNNLSRQIVNGFISFFLLYNVGIDFHEVGGIIATIAGSGLILSAICNPLWHIILSMRKNKSSLPKFDVRYIGLASCVLDSVVGAICFVIADAYKSTLALIMYSAICVGILGSPGDQIYHTMMGWILDEDEKNNNLRREGMFYACNGAIQHMSVVFYFVMIAIFGALGQDPTVCPQQQKQEVKDCVVAFLILSRVLKLVSALGYFKYEITGDRLVEILKLKKENIAVQKNTSNNEKI